MTPVGEQKPVEGEKKEEMRKEEEKEPKKIPILQIFGYKIISEK